MIDGVILLDRRMVIPKRLRRSVLQTLHSAHQGTSGMSSRAHDCVYWPGLTADIEETRTRCGTCNRMAPSQPHLPPFESDLPSYPFQAIAADYFTLCGVKFLVVVDRFSGWPHMMRAMGSDEALGASGLIRCLKLMFATFGIPEEVSSDGGPEFVAAETQAFLQKWGVRHRRSAAYNARSNGRAEVAVKSMKRLLQSATTAEGALNEDRVLYGLLQYRNTPQTNSGSSPAQILFGRQLKDRIPIPPGTSIFTHPGTAPGWREMWSAREEALRIRFGQQLDARQPHTRALPSLRPGDVVQIQNGGGNHPTKWDRTGKVLEVRPFDQHLVRVDGSGRITCRSRKALRRIAAFDPDRTPPPTTQCRPPPTVMPSAPVGTTMETRQPPPTPETTTEGNAQLPQCTVPREAVSPRAPTPPPAGETQGSKVPSPRSERTPPSPYILTTSVY